MDFRLTPKLGGVHGACGSILVYPTGIEFPYRRWHLWSLEIYRHSVCSLYWWVGRQNKPEKPTLNY